MPKTNTVMHMVLLMPVLADTVATTLMVVVLVLLATLPTLAEKVLPCVSVPLVEIVQLLLVEAAMAMNTPELLLTAEMLATAATATATATAAMATDTAATLEMM